MKRTVLSLTLMLVTGLFFSVSAQNVKPSDDKSKIKPPVVHGPRFVDKNGDGFNDNAPDHDGDGIPNGVDPDYKKGTGMGSGFVDKNGDGINDNAGRGQGMGRGGKGSRGQGMMGRGQGRGPCAQNPVTPATTPTK